MNRYQYEPPDDTSASILLVGSLIMLLLVLAGGVGFFLLNSLVNQQVVQPVERQNLNHDAAWMRAKTAEVTNLYHDFTNAKQAEDADIAQIRAYIEANGEPMTWSLGDPRQQVYQQLFNKYEGDYQSEITDAQQYNADRQNPDYKLVWQQAELANYPASLDAGTQPGL